MNDPILRFTDGTSTKIVDILAPNSGWRLAKPYWNIRIAQRKGDGTKVNSAIAEGQRLVAQEYDNVIETIPLTAYGSDQNATIQTINDLLSLARQSGDYWAKTYEFDDVWMEVRPACADALTGYARVVQMRLVELTNPFGQPFFSPAKEAFMDDLSLIVEREPLWRALPPGEIIGPLYNYIKNPDFELWNNGVTDSQPDSWTDLETIQITGQNGQQSVAVHSGNYALKVRVSGSTLTGRFKGVTQLIPNLINGIEYTAVAWVRSDGVSNGVGRILITYSGFQLELYRSALRHGWTVYAATFTAGTAVTAINCEILTTAANTDGTVYFDSLMIIPGDWVEEAENGTLPYLSGSHIVNHWDQPDNAFVEAGDINYVDVWDVPGTEDALLRLEVQNNTTSMEDAADGFAVVRIGQRRTKDIFFFDNYFDPPGETDTTASSDDRLISGAINNTWQDVAFKDIAGQALTIHNEGRFRAFARVYDPSSPANLLVRLKYFLGSANVNVKILASATVPVSGQWCMVNLTPNAAIAWDAKFATDAPSALGYTIQFQRPTGSGVGRLDYVLLMPTDGGYLGANIVPGLASGNALIVDNTASQSVSATNIRSGTHLSFSAATGVVFDMVIFKGDLYAAESSTVYRMRQGTWVDTGNFLTFRSMGVYQDFIHGCNASNLYRSRDGIIWSVAAAITGPNAFDAMMAFNGLLFCGGQGGTSGVWTWNGTTLTRVLSTLIVCRDLVVWNNRLYAIGNIAGTVQAVFAYNPVTNTWTNQSMTSAVAIAECGAVFNNRLYVGSNAGGLPTLYSYDGLTWVLVRTFTSVVSGVNMLRVYNNRLFIGTGSGMFVMDSNETITTFGDVSPAATVQTGSAVFNGALFYQITNVGSVGIYAVSDSDSFFSVSDYQGTPFTSPPQKRHRFFFNVDRQNYINNVDDAMLIGIGFVPRYLGLRGNG